MFTTNETVGLAEWIIDDTFLVDFLLQDNNCLAQLNRGTFYMNSKWLLENLQISDVRNFYRCVKLCNQFSMPTMVDTVTVRNIAFGY